LSAHQETSWAESPEVPHFYGAHAVPGLHPRLQDLGRGAPFASAFYQRIAMRYEDFQALVDRE
jgi:hypothetical protein